jgi:isopenicillin N synthase-like dioxygenase
MVAANSQWLVPTICCTCNGNNPTDKTLGMHGQGIALNYYPPCPQPELTFGLPGHTDPSIITILLIDDVPGLQVLKNGKWVNIRPIPNTFVVNVGDQIQVNSFFS